MKPAPDRYAVFGHPIGHSQSPRIHAWFAAETGEVLTYDAQDVKAEQFPAAMAEFLAAGGRGLNCTVPLKELAFRRADALSERAQRAKAVNTLKVLPDGALFGDNTDGAGLIRDLTSNLGLMLRGQRLLILGAGGASRGIIEPLLEQQPTRLTIANRTAKKALQLAHEFSDLGPVTGSGLADLKSEHYDLILNATAASLSGDLPDLPPGLLAPGGSCYDLAYGKKPTAFVHCGQAHDARLSVDGIGMLVEQAAEAFQLWRGIRPDTAPVIAALEAARHPPARSKSAEHHPET